MKLKIVFNKAKQKINGFVDICALHIEIKNLKEEIESFKKKELKYINNKNRLEADNRTLRLLNVKSQKKIEKLEEKIKEYERRENERFQHLGD